MRALILVLTLFLVSSAQAQTSIFARDLCSDRAATLMALLDHNRDGWVSRLEAERSDRDLRQDIQMRLESQIATIDRDRDGRITLEEVAVFNIRYGASAFTHPMPTQAVLSPFLTGTCADPVAGARFPSWGNVFRHLDREENKYIRTARARRAGEVMFAIAAGGGYADLHDRLTAVTGTGLLDHAHMDAALRALLPRR